MHVGFKYDCLQAYVRSSMHVNKSRSKFFEISISCSNVTFSPRTILFADNDIVYFSSDWATQVKKTTKKRWRVEI